jgi:hypothetical protein
LSRKAVGWLPEEGGFSIITSYLRTAAQGEGILAFRADEYYWRVNDNTSSGKQTISLSGTGK